jgi:hypothetical protein
MLPTVIIYIVLRDLPSTGISDTLTTNLPAEGQVQLRPEQLASTYG